MRLPKLTFGKVLGGTAVVLVLTTGTAYAHGMVNSAEIVNGTIRSIDIGTGQVKSVDIKNGTVNSADVLDESLTELDLATDSVAATEIQDNSIDSGEIVDFGLTNQDVGVLFATVNANGTVNNHSGGVTVAKIGTGQYSVDFGVTVSFCAFVATVGDPGTGIQSGIADVADRVSNAEAVFVETRDASAGALADRAFHLIVVC